MIQTIALVFFCSLYAIGVTLDLFQRYKHNKKYITFDIEKSFAREVIQAVIMATDEPKRDAEAILFAILCGKITCEEQVNKRIGPRTYKVNNHEFYN